MHAAPAAHFQRDAQNHRYSLKIFPDPGPRPASHCLGLSKAARFDPTRGLQPLLEEGETSVASCDLVTGATGMLGSHIAERLIAQGRRVRALVRPESDTRFLEALGVELVLGDLTDSRACDRAVRGVEVVYHSAAKVGDWGTWAEFQAGCLDATENLGRAAAEGGGRAVPAHQLDQRLRSSRRGGPADRRVGPARAERLVALGSLHAQQGRVRAAPLAAGRRRAGSPLTVIRPSWLYGERDRTTTARLVERLRRRQVPIIGRGDNPLSAVYAGTVADAAILAARDPGSVGEAYNITHQGQITQGEFLNLFAEACGAARVTRHVPYRLAFAAALLLEAYGRLTRRVRPPLISRYATWLMGRDLEYSTAQGRDPARLEARPLLSREHRADRPLVPRSGCHPRARHRTAGRTLIGGSEFLRIDSCRTPCDSASMRPCGSGKPARAENLTFLVTQADIAGSTVAAVDVAARPDSIVEVRCA